MTEGSQSIKAPSFLFAVKATLNLDLHPSKSGDIQTGVTEQLQNLLLRYNDDFDGVILAYSGETLLSHRGLVHPYFPFVRIRVAVNLSLFRPEKGQRLLGRIHKIGADYIGLLVLGFINVAIARKDIRADLVPELPLGTAWVSTKRPEHRLEVGTEVWFRVEEIENRSQFMSLTGNLMSADTGATAYAAVLEDNASKKTRKRVGEEEHSLSDKKKKKKKKKKE